MKIITANRLTDGRVLYWTQGHGWTDDFARAAVLAPEDADAQLALALEDEKTEVVGPYLIEAEGQTGAARPAGRERLKESIRLEGPTTGSSKIRAAAGAEAG